MFNVRSTLIAAACVAAIATAAIAAGNYSTYPIVGGPSFCASGNPSGPGVGGVTGQAGIPNTCVQTVPAGPPAFTGNEIIPLDTGTSYPPASAVMSISQLGNGAYFDLGPTVTTSTIPNNTSFYFIDGAQSGPYTITLPANPIEGQLVKIVCEKATSGALNIAANTGATLAASGNPNTACVVFNAYSFRYMAVSNIWYRY